MYFKNNKRSYIKNVQILNELHDYAYTYTRDKYTNQLK